MRQPELHFEIAELINKSLEGTLTPGESGKLKAWISESETNQRVWKRLTNPAYLEEHLQYWIPRDTAALWKQLEAEISSQQSSKRLVFRKGLRYAAVVLPIILISSAAWYYIEHRGNKDATNSASLTSVHILPQGKVAQLILGNGQVLNLNDTLKMAVTEKDGTKVHNQGSMLSYTPGSGVDEGKTVYNMLLVPRGGEYQVTLSDGTKVWLNALSSLRYPTEFNDKERRVFLNGEAYFEVAKDEQQPFVVTAGKTNVTVLGTKFNVSSYANDPGQRITLAEGSVRINEMGSVGGIHESVLLKPGYEAFVKNENSVRIRKANIEATLAWKNGMFIFDSESLGSLMRKLSRWYGVEVTYDDGVDTLFHFTGRIRRYENITGILHLIELTGKVDFNIEGNKVEVIPTNFHGD